MNGAAVLASRRPERDTYRHGDLRRALIAAGIDLARAGGPDAIVLREATRRAGVVPNAAYRHFENREALVEAVRAAALSALADAMEREIAIGVAAAGSDRAAAARARLRGVGIGYLGFARRETGLFLTAFVHPPLARETAPDPAKAGAGGMNPFELLCAALDAMLAAGILPAARRPGAEYLAWSAVHGMAYLSIDGPLRQLDDGDAAALGARLVEMVERGLSEAT